ncbi:MAG: sulfatase-like hydrolase/transferase [Verrucomicrobiales bacterium]|nr:sulfatase-like hydrolase/transferase [Verrucomicrobiales bacterium]
MLRPVLPPCRFACLILGLAALGSLPSAAVERPNVIVIVAGHFGWGDLGLHGNPDLATPRLDALAESGLRLERFHVCPQPSTSLASLLTGRYHYRTGASGDTRGEGTVHAHELTVAEHFQAAGYETAYFGGWSHGSNRPHHPAGQGFDRFAGWFGPWTGEFEEPGGPDGPPADAIWSATMAFLSEQHGKDSPFFCLVRLPAGSITAPAVGGSWAGAIHESITALDARCGQLIDWLEREGLRKNTVIWFLSDSGPEMPPDGGKVRYNGHLRGASGSVHEGGVRVPAFVSWPGHIPAGTKFRRLTAHLDLLPTLLDLCAIDPIERVWLDGMSLAPALTSGGQPGRWPNRLLFTSWTPPGFAVDQASVAVRTDRWVALRDVPWRRGEPSETHSGWELYDLNADPHEWTDLSDDYPFLLSDMRADFSRWMDETTDDGLGPIPVEIGRPDWPLVTLRATEASPSGDWEAPIDDSGTVTDWRSSGQKLRWPVEIVAPEGLYEVLCPAADRGDAAGARLILRCGDERLDFPLPAAEPDQEDDIPVLVGEIVLGSGQEWITLAPAMESSQSIPFRRLSLRRKTEPSEPR